MQSLNNKEAPVSSHPVGLLKKQKSESAAKRAQNAPDTKSRQMRNIHPYVTGQNANTAPKLNVKAPGNS